MTSPEQDSSEPPKTALEDPPEPEGGEGPRASAKPQPETPNPKPASPATPPSEVSSPDTKADADFAAPEEEDPQQGDPPSKRLAQPGRRAQPVTVTMLKAAARSPEDVKEIVRVESRLREKKRVEPAEDEDTREGQPEEKSSESKPAPAPKPAPAAKPAPAPKPAPALKPAAQASPPPQPGKAQGPAQPSPPVTQARALPNTDNPQARAPQPRAPRSPKATPAPSAKAPSTSETPPAETPTEAQAAPPPSRPSAWPIAAAIVLTGAALTWAIRSTQPTPQPGSAAAALAAASPAPSAQAQPRSTPEPSRRGTLASFGRDHVVYSDGSGELVVLKGDAVSGELTLERVYVVRRDRQRDLGDAARPLHGVYLDDLHLERSSELRAATLEFRTRLAEARRKGEGLEALDAAAARLARAGGANLLIPLLEPTHPTLDRRAATIGLLQSRYRCALPHVAELIRRYKDGPQGRRLCQLSNALVGLDLDPSAPEAAAEALEAWCREHPLLDRFEQVPSRGADLPR